MLALGLVGLAVGSVLLGQASSFESALAFRGLAGVVSLGAGLFGYFGPQMLGILRDVTGSFAAGFRMIAVADLTTLALVVLLYRMNRRSK